ncbi:MAG: hypothetical protein K6B52_08420 [Clostridiales bacterium]|nr:hypothetical protein [Clostridiales bacterium]
MIDFNISLAGIPIHISAGYETSLRYCRDYITSAAPKFSVDINQNDIEFEREKSEKEDKDKGLPPRQFADSYLETLAIYRKISEKLPYYDTVLFHGAVVAVGNKSWMFTAPSGTGKTTHTGLWLKNIPGAYIVNGDKPLIKLTNGGAVACGTPWRGKEHYGRNVQVPLEGIVFLEQSAENGIKQVTLSDELPSMLSQCYRPADTGAFLKTLQLINSLAGCVKIYRMGCNMEDEAALIAYEFVRQ